MLRSRIPKEGGKIQNKYMFLLTGPSKPGELDEAVAETKKIMNKTQRMLKKGSRWLKALYNAHLEEDHDFEKEDAEAKDGDWKHNLERNNGFSNFGEYDE